MVYRYSSLYVRVNIGQPGCARYLSQFASEGPQPPASQLTPRNKTRSQDGGLVCGTTPSSSWHYDRHSLYQLHHTRYQLHTVQSSCVKQYTTGANIPVPQLYTVIQTRIKCVPGMIRTLSIFVQSSSGVEGDRVRSYYTRYGIAYTLVGGSV